jgi:DNA-binding winged helix-turn-helix (wHTH) protein
VETQPSSPTLLKFGPFELHSQSGELQKHGTRIRLSGQPLRILLLLLERPGEVVAREELRRQISGDGTFVDFEGGLNAAVNKLRRALNDSAEKPCYIETISGRGYRFIGVLDPAAPPPDQPATEQSVAFSAVPVGRRRYRRSGFRRIDSRHFCRVEGGREH